MKSYGVITDLRTNKLMKIKHLIGRNNCNGEGIYLVCVGPTKGFSINAKTVYHVTGKDSVDQSIINGLYRKFHSSWTEFIEITPLEACTILHP